MSWQSLAESAAIHIIIGIVLTLVIFGGGVWVGRTTHTCPQIDTIYVDKTDTVYITKLEQIKVFYPVKQAVKESDSVYCVTFDTTLVAGKDTVISNKKVCFDEANKTFSMDEFIEIRGYDIKIIDTVFSDIVKEVEVEVSPPFYEINWFGTVIIVLALILGMLI